jgi:hypothetical protein
MGFFYHTIRIIENGITGKPAYVFDDGKPPEMKKGVVSASSMKACT